MSSTTISNHPIRTSEICEHDSRHIIGPVPAWYGGYLKKIFLFIIKGAEKDKRVENINAREERINSVSDDISLIGIFKSGILSFIGIEQIQIIRWTAPEIIRSIPPSN